MIRQPPVLDVLWEPPPGTPPSVPVRASGPALLAAAVASAVCYTVPLHLLGAPWLAMVEHPLWFLHLPLVDWQATAPAVAAVFVGFGVFRLCWRAASSERHLGGPRLLTGKAALKEARRLDQQEKPGDLRIHPLLRLWDWPRHVLVSGSVGSGKTQILMPLADQLYRHRIPALVLDTKGDYTSIFPQALILSPWDERSAYWDIGTDLRTKEQASAFADALIPLSDGNGRHFDMACRQILTGVIVGLQQQAAGLWGWRMLAKILGGGQARLVEVLERFAPASADLIRDPKNQTTSTTLSALSAHCRVIDDLAIAWGDGDVSGRHGKPMEKFSLSGWRHSQHRTVCLHAGLDQSLSRAWLAAFYATASGMLLRLPDSHSRRVFLLLDELTAIGRIDLAGLFERGRSKGVCVVAGFQDLAQVRAVYGKDFADALSSMVGTQIVCQIGPGETRERVAEWCGSERIAIPTITHSGVDEHGVKHQAVGVHEENRKLVLPAELTTELGVRNAGQRFWIRSLLLAGGDTMLLEWPGRKWAAQRSSHMPAAWCRVPGRIPEIMPQVGTNSGKSADGLR